MSAQISYRNAGDRNIYEEIAQALKDEGIDRAPEPEADVGAGRPQRKLTLLTAREAAEYLHVSLFTLSRMEKEGKLVPFRTPGGHRRYSVEMLNEYLERSRLAPRRRKAEPTPVEGN